MGHRPVPLEPFNLNAIWLGIGVTFGTQQIVMTLRGRRMPASSALRPA